MHITKEKAETQFGAVYFDFKNYDNTAEAIKAESDEKCTYRINAHKLIAQQNEIRNENKLDTLLKGKSAEVKAQIKALLTTTKK
jgi:hypothetical protein